MVIVRMDMSMLFDYNQIGQHGHLKSLIRQLLRHRIKKKKILMRKHRNFCSRESVLDSNDKNLVSFLSNQILEDFDMDVCPLGCMKIFSTLSNTSLCPHG